MSSSTQFIRGVSANNNSQVVAGTVQGSVYFGASESERLADGSPDLNNVLNSLPTAADAPFNAYQRQHDPSCLPDTRVDLLREIFNWADKRDEQCIFWLNSLAGTGKSTIARLVREQLEQLYDRVDVTSAGLVHTPLS
jgi:hypothetical protein